MEKRLFAQLSCVLVLLLIACLTTEAQVASASLLGEVRDAASAVITGAKVTARHEATGFSRVVITGEDGSYRIDDLLPGSYTVTAEQTGFRTTQAGPFVLEVNQKAKLDFQLQVGAPAETVNVTADISPLQTDDSSVGYRLGPRTIRDLPLDSRNVVALLTLGPGVIPRQLGGFGHDIINEVQESRGAVALNPPVNGGRSTMNTFLLDGALNTDLNTRAIAVTPPLETVQEFRTQSTLAPAEFAQSGGGIADIVTKVGSQEFHGSLFEYVRNEALDARTFFEDTSLPRPIFRQHQFGGSVSAPVPFTDKTFLFAAYEGLWGRAATASLGNVPDAAMRAGDFTGRAQIFDPLNVDPMTGRRLPFANNRIPAGRIDPAARLFLERFTPLPNRPGQANNFISSPLDENRSDNVSARVDHEFRENSRGFGRYTINDERNRLATAFPQRPTKERLRAQQFALGHTYGGATWLNEARLSFTRLSILELPESAFDVDVAEELGITGVADNPEDFGLPFFLAGNLALPFDTTNRPQTQRDNLWHFSNALSFSRGAHTPKLGFQWYYTQINYLQSNLSRGRFVYSGAFTSDPGVAGTGDPFADFLLGFPQVTERAVGRAQAYLRQSSYALFAQDDWRASDRLTLNLGLRYEYFTPFAEKHGNMLNLDFSTLPAPPRLVPTSQAVEPDRNNFAPRVGLAWRPPGGFWEGNDLVLRAGYGVYFSTEIATEHYDLVRNGLRNEINSTSGTVAPVLTTRNGFPQTGTTGFPIYFGLDPQARTPYMQQWTAGLQYELPLRLLLDLSYVGSKGTKLGRSRTFNTPLQTELGRNLPPRPGDLQSLRPFPQLGELIVRQHISNSSYHSMQLKLEKRFTGNFGLLASFVWSKSIDDSDTVLSGIFDSAPAQDERNLQLERGLSFFDVRRRLSVGFAYHLPRASFAKPVFSNWELSGILTLQDGTPLSPLYFFSDFANTGTPNRPDVVAGQPILLPEGQRSVERWINPAAFRNPAPFTFGNAGRNIIPGPGNALFDLALHRRFPFGESQALTLRAESFNLFNHPNLGIPLPFFDFGPAFGRLVGVGQPRRIQLVARYDF